MAKSISRSTSKPKLPPSPNCRAKNLDESIPGSSERASGETPPGTLEGDKKNDVPSFNNSPPKDPDVAPADRAVFPAPKPAVEDAEGRTDLVGAAAAAGGAVRCPAARWRRTLSELRPTAPGDGAGGIPAASAGGSSSVRDMAWTTHPWRGRRREEQRR